MVDPNVDANSYLDLFRLTMGLPVRRLRVFGALVLAMAGPGVASLMAARPAAADTPGYTSGIAPGFCVYDNAFPLYSHLHEFGFTFDLPGGTISNVSLSSGPPLWLQVGGPTTYGYEHITVKAVLPEAVQGTHSFTATVTVWSEIEQQFVDVIHSASFDANVSCPYGPSVSFRSYCFGELIVHLENGYGGEAPLELLQPNGVWLWMPVAAGQSKEVAIPRPWADHVVVQLEISPPVSGAKRRWEGSWQASGCYDPPEGTVLPDYPNSPRPGSRTVPATPGNATSSAGSGGGQPVGVSSASAQSTVVGTSSSAGSQPSVASASLSATSTPSTTAIAPRSVGIGALIHVAAALTGLGGGLVIALLVRRRYRTRATTLADDASAGRL